MIIFRPVRGSLEESMKECKKFDNVEEMKKYIVMKWKEQYRHLGKEPFTVNDIVIDESVVYHDTWTGWKDTKRVCINRLGTKDFLKEHGKPQCIGMCTEVE